MLFTSTGYGTNDFDLEVAVQIWYGHFTLELEFSLYLEKPRSGKSHSL